MPPFAPYDPPSPPLQRYWHGFMKLYKVSQLIGRWQRHTSSRFPSHPAFGPNQTAPTHHWVIPAINRSGSDRQTFIGKTHIGYRLFIAMHIQTRAAQLIEISHIQTFRCITKKSNVCIESCCWYCMHLEKWLCVTGSCYVWAACFLFVKTIKQFKRFLQSLTDL